MIAQTCSLCAWFFASQIRVPNFLVSFDFWRKITPESGAEILGQTLVNTTYGIADDAVGALFGRTISGSTLEGSHRVDAGVNTIGTILTYGMGRAAKGSSELLKSSSKLWVQFSKSTKGIFKGVTHHALRKAAYREMIRMHNVRARNVQLAKDFTKFEGRLGKATSAIENLLKDKE